MALGRFLRSLFGGESRTVAPEAVSPLETAEHVEPAWDDALFAAVRETDDDAPFAVLADWLTEQGDPRGELINRQLRGDRAEALLEQFPRHFYGMRAKAALFGADASIEDSQRAWDGRDALFVDWQRGFIERLAIPMEHGDWDVPGMDAEAVRILLTHPSCWRLQTLVFGGAMGGELGNGAPIPVCPTVRRVRIGDFMFPDECEMSWSELGSWDLAQSFPNAREVHVQGGLAGIALPSDVESFTLQSSTTTRELVQSLLAQLDSAQRVDLWTGSADYGSDVALDDVLPLLDRSLTHLGIQNCEFTDELITPLAKSAVLPGLKTLDLSLGTLTDDGAATLLQHADAFAHLERLDLDQNGVWDQAADLEARFGPRVVMGEQRDIEEYRYVAVSE